MKDLAKDLGERSLKLEGGRTALLPKRSKRVYIKGSV
jgi:hypothetical protein